jgi:hypothetical protein
MRRPGLFKWGLLIALSAMPPVISAEPESSIHLLLLNGNTGKPMAGVSLFVNPDCGGACVFPDNRMGWTANDAGEIEVPKLPNLHKLRLMKPNDHFTYCQQSENDDVRAINPDSFAVDDILRTGVIAPNTCNRHLGLAPHPGQLIFFLRPLTWWEELKKPPQM